MEQKGNSLGDRMSHAFRHVFSLGVRKAVIVGTDCPYITKQTILKAFEKLESSEVVIGPAADGGYYLLGLRRFIPELFHDIDWSTSQVYDQTMNKVQRNGIQSVSLEMLRDIDTIHDLTCAEIPEIQKRAQ